MHSGLTPATSSGDTAWLCRGVPQTRGASPPEPRAPRGSNPGQPRRCPPPRQPPAGPGGLTMRIWVLMSRYGIVPPVPPPPPPLPSGGLSPGPPPAPPPGGGDRPPRPGRGRDGGAPQGSGDRGVGGVNPQACSGGLPPGEGEGREAMEGGGGWTGRTGGDGQGDEEEEMMDREMEDRRGGTGRQWTRR